MSTTSSDFGVSPKTATTSETPAVALPPAAPTPTLPIKITLRGQMRKNVNTTAPTSVDGTNVSDLLSGNDTSVEITPDTANNKVYICSCCVDTTLCRIM